MNPFSDELRLLWTLLLNVGVFWSAYRLTRRCGQDGRVQAICDAFLLYFLTQYAAVALPGVIGRFNLWTMSASATVVAAAMAWAASSLATRRAAIDEKRRLHLDVKWSADHLGLAAAAFFTIAYLGFYAYTQRYIPPIATDALVYHLPTAVQWLQTGRLGIYPTWYWNPAASYSPGTGSIFMAWWMVLAGNDLFVRFGQLPALLFIFFLVVRMCRLLGASRSIAGCIGIAAALSRPLFSEAIFPKDDLYVTSFIAAGVLALAGTFPWSIFRNTQIASGAEKQSESGAARTFPHTIPPSTVAACRVGVAIGFVLASKYTVLLACPIFLFLIDAPFRARWRLKQWGIASGVVLAMALPWYIRNIVLTGNPLFPVDIHLPGLNLPGLFGTERDQQLRSAGGVWHMFASTYHSLPAALIAILLAGWVATLIVGSRRAVWHAPLVRACVPGSAITLVLFLTTSPHHEVRYIFPLIVLWFAAGGFALTRGSKYFPRAMLIIAIGIAAISTLTTFSFELITVTAEYAGIALLIAGVGVGLLYLQARVLHFKTDRIALLAGAAALAGALLIYVEWSAYVGGYRDARFVAWQQPSGYPRQADLWQWVDENVPPDGSIAYANTFFVYPYYGFNFTRHVAYAPTRRGLSNFAHFPRMGERVPGDLIVRQMTQVMNADPDRDTWLRNLRAMNAGYLIVMKLDPDNPDLSADPPELRLARTQPKLFVPVKETEAGVVFRLAWD